MKMNCDPKAAVASELATALTSGSLQVKPYIQQGDDISDKVIDSPLVMVDWTFIKGPGPHLSHSNTAKVQHVHTYEPNNVHTSIMHINTLQTENTHTVTLHISGNWTPALSGSD